MQRIYNKSTLPEIFFFLILVFQSLSVCEIAGERVCVDFQRPVAAAHIAGLLAVLSQALHG